MLRPQVFALQENGLSVGLVASEKQAIDATLRSLHEDDQRVLPYADMYWNARGEATRTEGLLTSLSGTGVWRSRISSDRGSPRGKTLTVPLSSWREKDHLRISRLRTESGN